MIKNYLFLLMAFSVMSISAQISCPDSIKTSGQSSPSEPIFTLPNGQNGCDEDWPLTITIDGNIIYNFVSCSGGNLKYEIEPGQTPPSTFEMTADFGNGIDCSYDVSGNLETLTNESFELNKIWITPNPASHSIEIISNGFVQINTIQIFNITSQLVKTLLSNNFIDVSNLDNGLYIAKIQTNKGLIIKKIIKN